MTVAGGITQSPVTWAQDVGAGAGIGAGDWLGFGAGVVLGALTIVAMILIAQRQRVIQLRDRAAERAAQRAREDAERREREERDARLARREVWRAEYEEIRKLLERCEIIAYRVRNDGPFTAKEFADFDVATLVMNAEQMAERGVETLRNQLLQLASLVNQLMNAAVPTELAIARASDPGSLPDRSQAHRAQRLAVVQDRVTRELTDQISCAWQALRAEWGS